MEDFIKITYISNGAEFDLIANLDDIARLSYGFNQLEFKTPFPNCERNVSVSQKEFDRLKKILLEGQKNEQTGSARKI